MLDLLKDTPARCCDGISRCGWLQLGGLGMIGLSVPFLLRAEDARLSAPERRAPGCAKSCILLGLRGGPSPGFTACCDWAVSF
jgi:hypothetical protein